jgi:PAS domain-containing protein
VSFIANPANGDSQHRVIVVDANYIVQFSNPAFCQWVEKEAHELLGCSLIKENNQTVRHIIIHYSIQLRKNKH